MKFEWDKEKEKHNIAKHGIDFATAALVFGDDNRLEYYDDAHSLVEDRYVTIGMVNCTMLVLTVVYTERYEALRIISARVATNTEKEAYFDSEKGY